MFDREIVMDSLQKIRKAIETILERASVVTDPNAFGAHSRNTQPLAVRCKPK